MDRCEQCSTEWKERYSIAVRRFDKAIATATTITIVSAAMGLAAAILAALCVIKTHNFIANFEYVEETDIIQDGDGENIAIIGNGATIAKEG